MSIRYEREIDRWVVTDSGTGEEIGTVDDYSQAEALDDAADGAPWGGVDTYNSTDDTTNDYLSWEMAQ